MKQQVRIKHAAGRSKVGSKWIHQAELIRPYMGCLSLSQDSVQSRPDQGSIITTTAGMSIA